MTPFTPLANEIQRLADELKDRVDEQTEALRRSEERLRLAQAVARIGTFEWNVQTGLNVWTEELEAMYGLEPGAFSRTQPAWEVLVHVDDRAAAFASVRQALASGLPTESEWRVVWPDGQVRWLAGRFQAFLNATGQPQRLTGINIDITDRKLAELEVVRLNQELEARVHERTQALERTVLDLRQALSEIQRLRGLLPLCAWCHKIRNDIGEWVALELYLGIHADTTVTHSICPACSTREGEPVRP